MFKKLIIGIVFGLIVGGIAACSLQGAVRGFTTFQTAPVADSVLTAYLVGDRIAAEQIQEPLDTLRYLYGELDHAVGGGDLVDYFTNTQNLIGLKLAKRNWIQIVSAVVDYSKRTGKPIPDDLKIFFSDVTDLYEEIDGIVERRLRGRAVAEYAYLLAKVLFAMKGIPL